MDVNSIISMASETMLWMLLGIVGACIVGVAVWINAHKIHVRIRDITDGNKYITTDRGRIVKDAKGTRWFKLLKRRDKLPAPPSRAFHIGKRGKRYIDFYLTEDGVYLPIIDSFDFEDYKHQNEFKIKEHLEAVDAERRQVPALVGIYEPFTTNQRSLFVTEMMESDKYMQKDWLQHLKDVLPYLTFIIMLVILVVFWGEITAPFLEAMNKGGALLDAATKAMEQAQQCGAPLQAQTPPN